MKKPTRVERKRQRRRIYFRLVLMLALLSVGVGFAFKSDFFNIEYINVKGDSILKKDSIINASGLLIGENLLKISPKETEDKIKLLPYIKDADVKYKIPNTINIQVVERVPVIQLKSLANYLLIDKEGFVVEITDIKKEELPTIVGYSIKEKEPGENIKDDENGIKLEEFFTEDDIIKMIKKINNINFDLEGEINIDLNNGIGVAFGPLDNIEYKLRLLDRILVDIENKQLKCKMIIMNKGENPILVLDNE